MTNATLISRRFTVEESSAIASILVEDDQVTLAYQTNPEQLYSFNASGLFVEQLEAILDRDPIQGLGSFVAASRRSGDLQEVTA